MRVWHRKPVLLSSSVLHTDNKDGEKHHERYLDENSSILGSNSRAVPTSIRRGLLKVKQFRSFRLDSN